MVRAAEDAGALGGGQREQMTPTSERTILEEAAVALRNDALVALLEHTAVLLDLAGEPRARGRGFRAAAVRVSSYRIVLRSLRPYTPRWMFA